MSFSVSQDLTHMSKLMRYLIAHVLSLQDTTFET